MRLKPIFKGLGVAASLYIVLFVAVMYSGKTFITPFVMRSIVIISMLLFGMARVKGVQRLAFQNHEDKFLKTIVILIVVFFIYQMTFSYDPHTTFVFIERFIAYGLLLFFVPDLELSFRVIKAIRWYTFPVAISVILTTFINGRKSGGLVGTYQYAGMMMSISFVVMLINYYIDRDQFDTGGILLSLLALFMSGKRTFSLIAVVAYLLVARINNNRNKNKKFITLSLFMLVAVVAAYITIPPVRLLLERVIIYSEDETYNGRIYLWNAAIDIFKQNKFTGIGMGCFSRYFDVFYHRLGNMEAMDTHNVYLQMAAELGIIGESLFIILFLTALVKTFKLLRNSTVRQHKKAMYVATYSFFLQIWFIIYNFTGNPLYGSGQCFFYFSAIAMMISVNRYVKKYAKQKQCAKSDSLSKTEP